MKPKIFIGSSFENKDVANAIFENLEDISLPLVWDQDVFSLSQYPIESILQSLALSDFAVFVFSADDIVKLREEQFHATRDNVVFELGLAMGMLGRNRTAIVVPRGLENFRIPSDLKGMNYATYDPERSDNLKAATRSGCEQIKRLIRSSPGRQGCAYLARYVAAEEPSFLEPDCTTAVSYERAYQILLYMFSNETFKEFRAFDLAFDRWEELLRDRSQTINYSSEIIGAMGRMFQQDRCRKFRRILVVTSEQLKSSTAAHVLRKIEELEKQWRATYRGLLVESRVLIYPDKSSPGTQRKIGQLHDFALFAGEAGGFAIVENTLTSPYNQVAVPECRIVTTEKTLTELGNGFEDFWGDCLPIAGVLEKLHGSTTHENAIGPAFRAYEHFLRAYPRVHKQCAVFVEAGYFEMHNLEAHDRFFHLKDALWLSDMLFRGCPNVQGGLFLEAFLNDLGTINVCQIEACGSDTENDMAQIHDTAQIKKIREFLNGIKRQHELHSVDSEEFFHFSMKKTRNDVSRIIKKALADRKPGIREEDLGQPSVDVYADPQASSPILLGQRAVDSSGIVPRCSALLAQHYHDLYRTASKLRPGLKELWIFDFNRLTEAESVRMGAEASFVLHSWPQDFTLNIVNCIYSPSGNTGTIQTIRWPA